GRPARVGGRKRAISWYCGAPGAFSARSGKTNLKQCKRQTANTVSVKSRKTRPRGDLQLPASPEPSAHLTKVGWNRDYRSNDKPAIGRKALKWSREFGWTAIETSADACSAPAPRPEHRSPRLREPRSGTPQRSAWAPANAPPPL